MNIDAVAALYSMSSSDVQRALDLHTRLIVVDGSGVVFRKGQRTPLRDDRFTTGGVTAVNHTVTDPDVDLSTALQQIDHARRWIHAEPDRLLLCRTGADIRAAKESGRAGVIFGPQDSAFLDTQLSRVGTFHDVGVRIMQLTYQTRNTVGDGCGEPAAGGLSRFGRDVVREMGQAGMVVDLSPCSIPTGRDAIELADGPVIFSHAHPAAVTPHIRAKDDDSLRALADKGGVIGLTALSTFVKTEPGVQPTIPTLMHHLHYLVDLIGIDHVGFGLDYNETHTVAEGMAMAMEHPELRASAQEFPHDQAHVAHLEDATDFPHLTLALVAEGVDDESIAKLLGGNFLRVFDAVWA